MEPPSLASYLPAQVQQYLIRVAAAITSAQTSITNLSAAGFVKPGQVPGLVDPTSVRSALQANGKAPLNVTNLVGVLAQPQLAGAPLVTALPAFNNILSQSGSLVRFGGQLYFFDQTKDPGSWKPVAGVGVTLTGTHAQRIAVTFTPPTLYPTGSTFYETDRGLLYMVISGNWTYLSGTYSLAQAGLAAVATGLGTHDSGLLVNVTDFAHILQWSGSAWGWGPGESGSGYFQDFAIAPTGAGWHICDGSFVGYLTAAGAAVGVTLPNTASPFAYRKGAAAYSATVVLPVVPTIAGSTDSRDLHPGLTTGTAGAGINVVDAIDNPHTHTLSAANAPISLPGDPVFNYSAVTYFRQ